MSQDELKPQRINQMFQQWKDQIAMIDGRVSQNRSDAVTGLFANFQQFIFPLIADNNKLKKEVEDLKKLIPKPKELPKSEMPPKPK